MRSRKVIVGPRRGALLLETLVGIVLLVTAGLAMVASIGQTLSTAREVHRREEEVRSASDALDAISLWPRATLDARLGRTRWRDWNIRIDRLTPTLYRVAIADTVKSVVLLETSIYTPGPANGEP
jgi:Tfp pilus assembly protein PilV